MYYCHACVTEMTSEAICCPKCGTKRKGDNAQAQKKNDSVSGAKAAAVTNIQTEPYEAETFYANGTETGATVKIVQEAEGLYTKSGYKQNTLLYRTLNHQAVAVIADEEYESYDSVTIPASVKHGDKTYQVTAIGDRAFAYCSSLTGVTIPIGITDIGDFAFLGCSRLTDITIPNSVTSIGDRVFYGCSRLTGVTIPNSVTFIGERAFEGCIRLTGVALPNSGVVIGDHAFPGTTAITRP